MFGTT